MQSAGRLIQAGLFSRLEQDFPGSASGIKADYRNDPRLMDQPLFFDGAIYDLPDNLLDPEKKEVLDEFMREFGMVPFV